MNKLEDFVVFPQNELFETLCELYAGKAFFKKDGFILVPGEAPVMLLAHLDTVHKETVKQICATSDGDVLMSPQGIGGDDRCGVYALVTVYKSAAKKPWLLFTCDEEIGGVGAGKFCAAHAKGKLPEELDELKMLIEIDRKGSKDAVYYDCGNDDFEKYITSKGFKTEFGSFSDISLVAPELGVAAVNLSSGYYNAHTPHEYIIKSELNATILKLIEMVAESVSPNFPKYDYVEKICRFDFWLGGYKGPKISVKGKSDFDSLMSNVNKSELMALLMLYDEDELADYCRTYGDMVIHQLYENEFGGLFPEEVLAEYGIDDDEESDVLSK